MSTLYETDFYSWTREQADRLRGATGQAVGAPQGLDWANLAEEIRDLGWSLERELYGRYKVLLAHLLKWRVQPGGHSGSWKAVIDIQRIEIGYLLRDNSGLRRERANEFADAFRTARLLAMSETGFGAALFPGECPFRLEDVEDEAFWPDAVQAPDF